MDAAPETFVDAFGEISFKHGVIRIELMSLSGPEPRVTQRLITSLQAFQQMLQAQHGMLDQLQKAGVIRPAQPASEAEAAPEQGGIVAAVRRLVRVEPVLQAVPAPPNEPAPQPAELAPPRSPNFSDEQ
jgi:hypothetical protein